MLRNRWQTNRQCIGDGLFGASGILVNIVVNVGQILFLNVCKRKCIHNGSFTVYIIKSFNETIIQFNFEKRKRKWIGHYTQKTADILV